MDEEEKRQKCGRNLLKCHKNKIVRIKKANHVKEVEEEDEGLGRDDLATDVSKGKWMDGQSNGQTDGRTERRMDGRTKTKQ